MSMILPDQLIVLRSYIKDEGLSHSFHGTNMHQMLASELHINEEGWLVWYYEETKPM